MKCRHQGKRFLRRWIPITPGLLPKSITAETDICADCGEWFGIGPANDDSDAVRIEKRAAELARRGDLDGDWNGFESLGMVSPEAEHTPLIERDIAEGRKYPRDLDAYLAGHLAACIVEGGER